MYTKCNIKLCTMNSIPLYNTRDLALAGFLLTHGFHLVKADKENPKNIVFFFEYVTGLPPLEAAVAAFYSGQATVEPQSFYRNTKLLKTVIYGGYKTDESKHTD